MSMTSRIMTVLAVAGLFVAGAVGVGAQDISWNVDEGDWLTDTNWDPVRLPGAGDDVDIDRSDADVTLDSMTGDISIGSLWMYQGALSAETGEHEFRVTSGRTITLISTGTDYSWTGNTVGYGSGNEAVFNVNGDVFFEGGIGAAFEGATGTINVNAGKLTTDDIRLGYRDNSVGTLNLYEGASVNTNELIISTEVGDSTGTFNMHGGSLTVGDGLLLVFNTGASGTPGTGTFNMHTGEVSATGNIEVGAWRGRGPATFNMDHGTLSTEYDLRIGAREAANGTFNMEDGTVNVDGELRIGGAESGDSGAGSGTFNMSGGTMNVDGRLIMNHRGGTSIFNQTGGTVSMPESNWAFIGLGGTGTYTIKNDAKLDWQSDSDQGFSVASSGATGTFVKYGSADVEIRGTYGRDDHAALMIARDGGTGTFRAVIDQSGFDPIRVHSDEYALGINGVDVELQAGNANLEVALDGGVMLGVGSFQLIESIEIGEVRGRVPGTNANWNNLPDHLWTVYTGEEVDGRDVWGVQIALNTDYDRGTLDASMIGSHSDLDEGESGPHAHGYVLVENLGAEQNLVQLALGFAGEGSGEEEEGKIKGLIGDFTADLESAGYVWYAGVSDFEIGLDITVIDQDEGLAAFAWDFSDYQTENPSQLELSSLTVIPEPSSIAIIVLGLAAVIRLRLRGRRNF